MFSSNASVAQTGQSTGVRAPLSSSVRVKGGNTKPASQSQQILPPSPSDLCSPAIKPSEMIPTLM